jgi:hypothetical protein
MGIALSSNLPFTGTQPASFNPQAFTMAEALEPQAQQKEQKTVEQCSQMLGKLYSDLKEYDQKYGKPNLVSNTALDLSNSAKRYGIDIKITVLRGENLKEDAQNSSNRLNELEAGYASFQTECFPHFEALRNDQGKENEVDRRLGKNPQPEPAPINISPSENSAGRALKAVGGAFMILWNLTTDFASPGIA